MNIGVKTGAPCLHRADQIMAIGFPGVTPKDILCLAGMTGDKIGWTEGDAGGFGNREGVTTGGGNLAAVGNFKSLAAAGAAADQRPGAGVERHESGVRPSRD